MRSLRARLVVQALCVWNGSVLVLVGALFLVFGDRPEGLAVALGCGLLSTVLFAIARRAGKGTGWN